MVILNSLYVKSIITAGNTDILSMKKCLLSALLCFFALNAGLFGAEITVPNVELASRGVKEDGNFEIRSSLDAEIAVTGGYKYGFTLGLGAEIPNLEKALSYGRFDILSMTNPDDFNDRMDNQPVLAIRSIKATAREIFNTPLEISFFIGRNDKLGSGDEFQEYFGTVPIGTGLKGFFYYPEGLNGDPFLRYNGAIHNILGTGLSFKAVLGNFVPAVYIYQDLSFMENQTVPGLGGNYQSGRYSGDVKLLANWENAKFEIFFGGTYSSDEKEVLRGGALAWFGSGPIAFLLQAGIPYYEAGKKLDIDNCYFLMESRLRLEKIGAKLTFFYNPVYYMNQIIWEGTEKANGRADINLRMFYGDITKSAFEAGLESTAHLKIQDGEDYRIWVSPFVSIITSGLQWDLALRFNPRHYWKKGDLMEGFIGIRTAY